MEDARERVRRRRRRATERATREVAHGACRRVMVESSRVWVGTSRRDDGMDATRDEHVPRGANAVDYGWRAGSSALPRAARAIENVNEKSLVRLRATVLSERERARTARARASGAGASTSRANDGGDRPRGALVLAQGVRRVGKRKADGDDARAKRNAGVDARAARDVSERIDRSSKGVRGALERKAALYERLSSGELAFEDGDAYDVDFGAKRAATDDNRDDHDAPIYERQIRRGDMQIRRGDMMSNDMRRELERREWEEELEREERDAAAAAEARRVVFDIERQTERERDAAEDAKRRRDEEDAARREKLKAAFIRKKMAAMGKK